MNKYKENMYNMAYRTCNFLADKVRANTVSISSGSSVGITIDTLRGIEFHANDRVIGCVPIVSTCPLQIIRGDENISKSYGTIIKNVGVSFKHLINKYHVCKDISNMLLEYIGYNTHYLPGENIEGQLKKVSLDDVIPHIIKGRIEQYKSIILNGKNSYVDLIWIGEHWRVIMLNNCELE